MNDRVAHSVSGDDAQASLRDELARADAAAATMAPVLRHLLAVQDTSPFSDEVLARVRGMVADLAAALVGWDGATHSPADADALAEHLIDNRALLAHLHAIALEWQLAERLQSRLGLDLVRTPSVHALAASGDAAMQSLTARYLAAQARWVAAQRRMTLTLGELPAELLHEAVLTMQSCPDLAARAEHVQARVLGCHDEGESRLGLAAHLVANWPDGWPQLLSVMHSGVTLFLSALALRSGQGRDALVLSLHEGQVSRLALALRSAGVAGSRIEEQLLVLHPGVGVPPSIGQLAPDEAAYILASGHGAGHGQA